MNEGKKFEEDFSSSIIKDGIFIYRLRDSSSGWNDGKTGRFTVTNACDFISFNPNTRKVVLFECKSFKGKSCSFTNIKKHQVEDMYKHSLNKDVEAYFIFNFRDIEETYSLSAEEVKNYMHNSERRSIPLDFCREKGILIESIKKRVRFYYNINTLYDKLKEKLKEKEDA